MAGQPILIAAFSGRAAAASARRAGFAPLVADLFADDDTCAIATDVRCVDGNLDAGFSTDALIAALIELAEGADEPPVGLVCDAGFEDRPALLIELARRWPLLGNAPETVAWVKNPWRLADTLRGLAIAHPEIKTDETASAGWLSKRPGGAGGDHVGRAGPGTYAQRRVAGRSVSALFVAGAGATTIVGFSEQWTAPTPGQLFRFGGAVAPAELDASLAGELSDAIRKAAAAFGLRGLNSVDFIIGPQGWWLIEINPRLSATLDVFDDSAGTLFSAHIAAVSGLPAPAIQPLPRPRALQIVYIPSAIASLPRLNWPDWAADRTPAGQPIPAGAPLCSILASAKTACEARRLCLARAECLLEMIGLPQWTARQLSA